MAGGSDLMVDGMARIGKRELKPMMLAIHLLAELQGRTYNADGSLALGALTTHAQLERDEVLRRRYSALVDAASLVGSPATRNVGTIGGNIANGSPAMDTGSPLLCFDARVELASAEGARSMLLSEFLRGPGRTARIQAGELLTAVQLPALPAGRVGSAYVRHDYRASMEVAVVGAAALITVDDADRITDARLALTAVAPVCRRVPDAERLLRQRQILTDDLLDDVVEAARVAATPIDDVRASASYRAAITPVVARRSLALAVARINGFVLPPGGIDNG